MEIEIKEFEGQTIAIDENGDQMFVLPAVGLPQKMVLHVAQIQQQAFKHGVDYGVSRLRQDLCALLGVQR